LPGAPKSVVEGNIRWWAPDARLERPAPCLSQHSLATPDPWLFSGWRQGKPLRIVGVVRRAEGLSAIAWFVRCRLALGVGTSPDRESPLSLSIRSTRLVRRDLLGGLIHEYELVA
jgi:hypothetical protein